MKKMRIIVGIAFLLNTFLFGSYYSVAKEVLGRVDPIVFTFFAMMTLVPPGLFIVAFSWRHMTRDAVKSGFLLGSCLCLGLFTLSVALKYNSATGTAFFPSLNGLLAVFFTWCFLRQRITKATWFAGVVSVTGAVLLMLNASMGGLRGSLIAFIGGLFCTFYIFLADREQKDPAAYWPLFGVELLTMGLWACLVALLFGDWHMANFLLPKDVGIVLYIGLGTTFLPTLITVLLQKYISPITVSFIYILEPIFGAIVAALYLHEVLPLDGYIGGGLVVLGALIHTWSSLEQPASKRARHQQLVTAGQRVQTSLPATLFYPIACCVCGIFVVYKLGGFPPPIWHELYSLGPHLPTLIQQGHGMDAFLIIAQSSSWLLAWIALLVMGCLATYRAMEKMIALATSPAPAPLPSPLPEQAPTLQPPAAHGLNVRTLRQMGYTPYALSTGKRKEENELVQRRRMQRQMRLTRVEPFAAEQVLTAEQSAQELAYRDTSGNHWVCWDDVGLTEMRER